MERSRGRRGGRQIRLGGGTTQSTTKDGSATPIAPLSKPSLPLAELQNRAFALLAQALALGAKGDVASRDELVAMLRIYVDFGLSHPDMYRIAFMADNAQVRSWLPQSLSPATQSTYGVLRAMITDLHARGLTVDLDPETLTQSTWSGMHGLVSLMIAKPGFPWVEREHLITSHLGLIAGSLLQN